MQPYHPFLLTLVCVCFGGLPLVGQTFQRSVDAFDTLALPSGGKASAPEQWEARRKAILEGMQAIMGTLPGEKKRVPLDVRTEEEVDCGTYVRRLISYASEPGSRTPAYLCVPKSVLQGAAAPGVLCLHPTDSTAGNKVVVGLGGKANRQYASELTERGFVTIAPAYPLLANYQPDLKALGWESGTLKAVWDNMRALDVLDSLSYVKHGKYGAIGHSLGGHNSVYTAVFDPRIQVIVSSCGLDSYRDYYGGDATKWVAEKGWCQTRYMLRLANYQNRLTEIPFDFPELLSALAPRHVLICAPLKDSNFKWESVDRVAESARRVYALHGAADRIAVEHPDCDHDFPDAVREKAYALMTEVLKP
ncbi:MAG TPA: alpha/beta hydrolase [Candidatus Saccharimonadia bacterium]|nr:alpha/beta hydrolase [Candidatus Saccharimonadia bacterium]